MGRMAELAAMRDEVEQRLRGEVSEALYYQPHSPTSYEAAQDIRPSAGNLRAKVLAAIASQPNGATDERICEITGLQGNTVRPRRRELEEAGKVKDSWRYELTRSGRKAVLWVAT